ncbi:ankyrin-1-like [Phymastichus coffea]|uniref:ankyrin-1-like n=1 Tax=Phymastichus coffea TaxID=108790 RepID=UPI00273BFC68|nr:ankyrin-1-like [Phymastichus coffea]
MNTGWEDVIHRLVSFKCPIDAKYTKYKSNTAIHYAFYNKLSNSTIDLLLWFYINNNDPIENVTNDDGLSFLHIACSRENLTVIEKLINANPAAVNVSEKQSFSTPLHFAVQYHRHEVAMCLLQNKADIYKQNHDKSTPLHLALKLNDVAASTGHTPYTLAQKKGHHSIYYILKEYCRVSKDCCKTTSVVFNAAQFILLPHKNTNVAPVEPPTPKVKRPRMLHRTLSDLPCPQEGSQQLPSITIPINAINRPLENNAATSQNTISNKPELETSVKEQLTKALFQNNVEKFLSILKEKGCSLEDFKRTLLKESIILEHKPIVLTLLNKNYYVHKYWNANACDQTPLHMVATKVGWTDVVKSLLNQGFRADDKNNYSKHNATPLHFAVTFRRQEIAEYLIKHGADIYAQCNDGSTALHLALTFIDARMIDLLLAHDKIHMDIENK